MKNKPYENWEILESMLKQTVIDWAAKWDKIGIDEYEKGVCYSAAMFIITHRDRKK